MITRIILRYLPKLKVKLHEEETQKKHLIIVAIHTKIEFYNCFNIYIYLVAMVNLTSVFLGPMFKSKIKDLYFETY